LILLTNLASLKKASSELEYFIFQYSFYEAAEKGYKDMKLTPMFESDVY
jgi:hypothetical protein